MTAPGGSGRNRARPGLRRLASWIAGLALLAACLLGAQRAAYAVYPYPYRGQVQASARQSGLDPRLVLAVMRVESKFAPGAVSADGAVGLMQVTPSTAAWIAGQRGQLQGFSPRLLREPAYNIGMGAWYLGYLRSSYGGQLPPAIAAYNAGRTPVDAWIRAGTWDATLAGAGSIPYPETRLFVQRVLGTYAVYRLLYPREGAG